MASQKRKGVGAGVTALMSQGISKLTAPSPTPSPAAEKTAVEKTATVKTETRKPATPGSEDPETRTPDSSVSRGKGKPAVRKLTVDVPESVHDEYEDLYLDLRRTHRRLKRVQYAPLVIRFGLDRQKIEQALGV